MYEVWHATVVATHDFPNPSDLNGICSQVKSDYLPKSSLLVAVDDRNRVIGFMDTRGHEIELFFIDPAYHGYALGRAFIEAAATKSPYLEVVINEENRQAIAFYEAVGFSVRASSRIDHDGRPYPILRMRR